MGSNISITHRKGRLSFLIDCSLVLSNIINGGLSVLPCLVLDSIQYNLLFGAILNVIWCMFNSWYIKLIVSPKVLFPFIGVLIYQLFLDRFAYSITMLVLEISFLAVLCGMLGKYKEKTLELLSNTYIFYSLCNVIGVCLAFILILEGVLAPDSNNLDIKLITEDDGIAYFPGYLTVIRPNDVERVSFLAFFGNFCGFSHEPNAVGYVCLPAFFILLYKCREYNFLIKIIVIILYALFFLITISATAFISITIVTLVGLFMAGRQKGGRKNWIVLAILICILVLFTSYIFETFPFILNKLTASGGSKDYSVDRISYAFTPETFMGTTVYTTSVDGDIGIVTMFLNLCYYISAGLLCLRMLNNRNREVFYYGLALLYFLCHSMKIIIMVYRYPYTVFIIFLCYLAIYKNGYIKQKTASRNLS